MRLKEIENAQQFDKKYPGLLNIYFYQIFKRLYQSIVPQETNDTDDRRRKALMNASKIIKKFPKSILKTNEISGEYGIGQGTVTRLCELIATMRLKEIENVPSDYLDEKEDSVMEDEAREVYENLSSIIDKIDTKTAIELVGSYRRRHKHLKDLDFLIINQNEHFSKDFFQSLIDDKVIKDIYSFNSHKLSASYPRKNKKNSKILLDVYFINDENEYVPARFNLTGPKKFVNYVKTEAENKGYILTENIFYDKKKKIFINLEDEEELFDILEIDEKYLSPEERDNF
jgi:DNA polymerase/3'-5' exonuclease PolX